ncbi:MAG: hypothetical protein Ct9H300mP19_06630 [Dehalococcoidia bacterium]|nr:MAG: hypothetical protein Ct9H300mP19_06630 [Dehalococcoidia bacterium]
MPGGGAEVFSSRVHKILLPGKANADRWAEIHKTAHRMDIPTNCTLLYGHIESFEERVEHLVRLRKFKMRPADFWRSFLWEISSWNDQAPSAAYTCNGRLKMIAAARPILDNINT